MSLFFLLLNCFFLLLLLLLSPQLLPSSFSVLCGFEKVIISNKGENFPISCESFSIFDFSYKNNKNIVLYITNVILLVFDILSLLVLNLWSPLVQRFSFYRCAPNSLSRLACPLALSPDFKSFHAYPWWSSDLHFLYFCSLFPLVLLTFPTWCVPGEPPLQWCQLTTITANNNTCSSSWIQCLLYYILVSLLVTQLLASYFVLLHCSHLIRKNILFILPRKCAFRMIWTQSCESTEGRNT